MGGGCDAIHTPRTAATPSNTTQLQVVGTSRTEGGGEWTMDTGQGWTASDTGHYTAELSCTPHGPWPSHERRARPLPTPSINTTTPLLRMLDEQQHTAPPTRHCTASVALPSALPTVLLPCSAASCRSQPASPPSPPPPHRRCHLGLALLLPKALCSASSLLRPLLSQGRLLAPLLVMGPPPRLPRPPPSPLPPPPPRSQPVPLPPPLRMPLFPFAAAACGACCARCG